MTFAYCDRALCLRHASHLLPCGPAGNDSGSDSDSDAVASANAMLDTSDYEQDSTPPQQRAGVDSSRSFSEDNEESMLAVDEGLLELISSQLQAARDEVGFKHVQRQRDTDLDALLEEYILYI